MHKIIIISLFLTLIGCGEKDSPADVYDEYNSKVINGLSFKDEKKYYSTSKLAEIEASFPRYMAQMEKSKEEVIKFYQDFSQSVAKCKSIKLLEELNSDDGVVLIYSQTDICGNKSGNSEKQTVKMIRENGWKITSVETAL
jgi:hypothetical protein